MNSKRYNWSQKVLDVFSEELGLDKEVALRLTKGFGGGAGCGELCGAVTAGIMALGLKYGDDSKGYIEEFENRIEEKYASIRCKTMLVNKVKSEVCPSIIEDTIFIIEEKLNEKEVNKW